MKRELYATSLLLNFQIHQHITVIPVVAYALAQPGGPHLSARGTQIVSTQRTIVKSPCSITERMVPELIPVLGSQPAGDVSYKPGGRLPLLSARPVVTSFIATNFTAW